MTHHRAECMLHHMRMRQLPRTGAISTTMPLHRCMVPLTRPTSMVLQETEAGMMVLTPPAQVAPQSGGQMIQRLLDKAELVRTAMQ